MSTRSDAREVALAAFLVAVGLGAWLHWSLTDPGVDESPGQDGWGTVLAFSVLVVTLPSAAAALAVALSGARSVRLVALVLAVAGVASALTNIVEDGFGVSWMSSVFAVLTAVQVIALPTLAIALVLRVGGPRRVLALAPLASAVGVVLYVQAGGPILLFTWCAAATYLLATRTVEA